MTHKSWEVEVVTISVPPTPHGLIPAFLSWAFLSLHARGNSQSHVRFCCRRTGHRLLPVPHRTAKLERNHGKRWSKTACLLRGYS